MTVEEAINYFNTDPTPRNLWHPAYDVAVEALEKQIPERPVNIIKAEMMEWEFAHCPDCNGVLNHFMNKKFCPACGKALNWGGEE